MENNNHYEPEEGIQIECEIHYEPEEDNCGIMSIEETTKLFNQIREEIESTFNS